MPCKCNEGKNEGFLFRVAFLRPSPMEFIAGIRGNTRAARKTTRQVKFRETRSLHRAENRASRVSSKLHANGKRTPWRLIVRSRVRA